MIMQKVTKQRPITKTVPTGEFTKYTVFVASDGKEFFNKVECAEWERHVARVYENVKRREVYENVKRREADDKTWYFITNAAELDWFLGSIEGADRCYYNDELIDKGGVEVLLNRWYSYQFTEGGDYHYDTYEIYELEYYKALILDRLIKSTNELTAILESKI